LIAIILFINFEKNTRNTVQKTNNTSSPVSKTDSSTDSDLVIPEEKKSVIVASSGKIETANINVDSLIHFAESLLGTPYVYASSDPSVGFDCSGFITYVFNHFNVSVPRSSIDFTDEGITIPLKKSKRGDLILFTGTDSTERFVGHMGIIVEKNKDGISFIHSTSGKAHGVTITKLNDYYMGRFVKVVRIINE
jgi:cell wall-associated NlpC family hydrolase